MLFLKKFFTSEKFNYPLTKLLIYPILCQPSSPDVNLQKGMVLWIILVLAWAAILVAGICLCRIAAYTDKRVRRITASRVRRGEDEQAA